MNKDNMYLIMDTETGGTSKDTSLLTVYLGVVESTNETLAVIDELDLKIKPEDGFYIATSQGMSTNKIDLIKHDEEAQTAKELKTTVYEFLKQHSNNGKDKLVPIGHNVKGDIERIKDNLISDKTWDHFVSYRLLDTGSIGQFLKMADVVADADNVSGSLESWVNYFGIGMDVYAHGDLHTAKGDSMASLGVLKRFLQFVGVFKKIKG